MKKLKKMLGCCAPIALCYVSGINEDAVLRICHAHGFTEKEGMHDQDWQNAACDLGIQIRRIPVQDCTLKQFIRKNTVGLFLVCTIDHIFCVDNSLIFDPRCERPPGHGRIIKQAWKVFIDESRKSG